MLTVWAALLLVSVAVCWATCGHWVTDFSQTNCTSKTKNSAEDSFYYGLEVDSCMPKCYKYADAVNQMCPSDRNCMPGYSCQKRCGPDEDLKSMSCDNDQDCTAANGELKTCEFYCVANSEASCMAYHINNNDYRYNYWSAAIFKPVCNNDGTWQAKQCKGGVDGRCMCYDRDGGRIFGEAPAKSATNMTCVCSRRNSDLQLTRPTTFHCDSMGNFEPLQCDLISEQCWCTEPLTGDLISPVVPAKAVHLLSCFEVETYGGQYLRQCESKKYAQTRIKQNLNRHGISYVVEDRLVCDNDGSFGAYTLEKDSVYCTWRNNSKIGSYQTSVQSSANIDCNCARDSIKYAQSQSCQSNGNYKPLQRSESYWYCVDDDGFAKALNIIDVDENTADSYCAQYY